MATSSSFHVERFDVSGSWGSNGNFQRQLSSSIVPASTFDSDSFVIATAAPLASPFFFDFQCTASDQNQCAWAKQGFYNAGARIAKQLSISREIRIKATFRPFCNGKLDGCTMTNTLGQASPSAYYSAFESNNQNFFYPQALVKQLNSNADIKYGDYDIFADFNSDFDFWFKSSNLPIQAKQIDFEYTASHELTHGLGFDPSWAEWSTMMPAQAGYIAPIPKSSQGTNNQPVITGWNPLNIFDKFTEEASSQQPLRAYGNIIEGFQIQAPQTPDQLVKAFEASGAPFNAARHIYDIVVSGKNALDFHSTDGSILYLSTKAQKYTPGTSISHLDYDQYWQTPEFLMIPAVQDLTGKSVDSIISNCGGNGIYGPKTLALMNSIGWAVKGMPGPPSLQFTPAVAMKSTGSFSAGDTFAQTSSAVGGWFGVQAVCLVILFSQLFQ